MAVKTGIPAPTPVGADLQRDADIYWRSDIEKLMDLGVIAGVGNGKLGLTRSEAKSAVVALRLAERLFEQDGN